MNKALLILTTVLFCSVRIYSQTYSVTVTNGYGSGVYHVGDTVNVWSAAYDTTQTYGYWSGDSSFLAGAHEWHTTLIMPAQNVNLTANILAMPAYSIHYEQIMGENNLKNVYSYFPASMKGVLYLFHGTGGAAANWVSKPEYRSFIDAAIADTFGFIITEAEEVTLDSDINGDGKIRWFTSPGDSITNVDLANLKILTDTFINRGNMTLSTNRYAMGMSNGGAFSATVAYVYHYTAGVSYCAQSGDLLFEYISSPFAFRMALYDDNPQVGPAGNYQAWQNDSVLQSRGMCNSYLIHNKQPIYPQRFARVPGVSLTTSANIYNELVLNNDIDTNGYAIEDTLITQDVAAHPSLYPDLATLPGLTQLGVSNEIAASNAEHMFYSDWNYATLQFIEHLCVYPPSSPVISGVTTTCAGSTTSLSSTTTGGTWTSSNPSVASIGSASGIVTGVALGTTTISYFTSSGTASAVVTVNLSLSAGTITGAATLCNGSTTDLTDAVGGGSWNSGNTLVATVDATGIVTGVATGTATIYYSISGSCGTATATRIVTVSPTVSAGTISGAASVCGGSTIALTDAVTGGSWSSLSPGVASVGTSGIVTGVSAGTTIISYSVSNSCGTTAAATRVVTVNGAPNAGTIAGSTMLCVGSTTTLTDVATGGTWSSGSPAIASVSTTGLVTPVGVGTATISYTVTNSCGGATATRIVTVNALPVAGTITGSTVLCSGATAAVTDAAPGGSWSSASPAVATIGTAGLVTGLATGTTAISYTVTNVCGSAVATHLVTVNTTPTAGTISGVTTLCSGGTTPLTDAAAGGSWYSSNSLIAAVNATGAVTGVATGTATISYTISNSCGSATATTTVSVGGSASAGTITGLSSVFVSSTITLTDAVSGGTWAASNGNATVSATGVVTGLANGTVIISYTIISSCGTVAATKVVSVSDASVSAISGYSSAICAGQSSGFWDVTTGGTWGISPVTIATVSPTGVVTGISAGTATLSYTFGGSIVTTVVTIAPSPAAITGPDSICVGSSVQLTDPTPGGVWSSGVPAKITVTTTGFITCTNHSETNVPIYYTMSNGCRAVQSFVTDSVPGNILGPSKVCVGSSITLSDASTNGYWSGSTSYATVDGSGDVTGLTAGTSVITFASTGTGCYKISVITVNPVPVPISGTLSICIGSVTYLSDATTPTVSWISSNTAVATASFSGAVAGNAVGTSVITYTANDGCIRTAVVSVNPTPAPAAPIMGPSTVSHSGGSVTLTDATPGGVWLSLNTSIVTIGSSTGIATAVSTGSTYINYLVTNSFGCSSDVTKLISARPAPPAQTGSTTIAVGVTVSLTNEVASGEWTSSDNNVATVDNTGVVTGLAEGSASITHTVLGNDGTLNTIVTQVIVNSSPFAVSIIPNPNNGSFTIHGTTGSIKDEPITFEITNMVGQVVYTNMTVANGGVITAQVLLADSLANGMYLLNAKSENRSKVLHFVMQK